MEGLKQGERAAQGPNDGSRVREQPAALADGVSVSWEEIRPMLAEAAGAQVVQEAVLDRLLIAECRSHGVSITDDDIAAERKLLADNIVREARATAGDAERLLDSVRRSRGLGEVRFKRLLERNARMRKLVAPTVEVSEADVTQAFEMLHGVKYRTRVILTPGNTAAADARKELLESADHLTVRFAERAMKDSIDPSADRGGVVDPFSSADPAYPSSVREAVRALEPGQISSVLAVDRGFAIVLLEGRVPADQARLPDEAATIQAEIRSRRERQAMDGLGQRLIRDSHMRLLDRSLEWSLNAVKAGSKP